MNLPWQGFKKKIFTNIESEAGMAERLMRYLAIEEALHDEIKETLEQKKSICLLVCSITQVKK